MSRLTAQKLPTAAASGTPGTGNAWASPNNALSATDGAAVATVNTTSLTTPSQTLALTGFGLLAEDSGGTIPAGATIIRVQCLARVRVKSGNDAVSANNAITRTTVKTGGASGTVLLTNDLTTPKNTDTGLVTRTLDTGGTTASPQTTFARSDLSAANLAVCVQAVAGASVLATNNHDCDYAVVQVEWILYLDGPGGGRSVHGVASAAASAVTTSGGGGRAADVGGGSSQPLFSRGASGGMTIASGGAPAKPAVNGAGGSAIGGSRAGGSPQPLASAPGGGRALAQNAGAQHTLITTLPAGGRSAGVAGAFPEAIIQRGTSGGASTSTGGGPAQPLLMAIGGAIASAANAGAPTVLITTAPAGGRASVSTAGGVGRAYSYSIRGYAKNGQTNAPVSGVRCKVYRFSDDAVMGTSISDATGYFAVAIPRSAASPLGTNADETFWVRYWKGGTPNTFATTDDDLVLVEALIQGPPEP